MALAKELVTSELNSVLNPQPWCKVEIIFVQNLILSLL